MQFPQARHVYPSMHLSERPNDLCADFRICINTIRVDSRGNSSQLEDAKFTEAQVHLPLSYSKILTLTNVVQKCYIISAQAISKILKIHYNQV